MLLASIILEGCVAVIALFAAQQRRPYLYGLAFTFAAFAFYDFVRLMQWSVEGPVLSWLFLIAIITALVAVVGLYWDRGGR